MDAYEEAKEEHFESIRINVGHPSYAGTLTELNNKESTRRVSFEFADKNITVFRNNIHAQLRTAPIPY